MTKCCVRKCRSDGGHCFPKNINLQKEWVNAIRRENWTPTPTSIVCSAHFLPSDYITDNLKAGYKLVIKKLKHNAVPTVFQWPCVGSAVCRQGATVFDIARKDPDGGLYKNKPSASDGDASEMAKEAILGDHQINVSLRDEQPSTSKSQATEAKQSSNYKWCIVPLCKNTSIATPTKIFVSVPTSTKRRQAWISACGRDGGKRKLSPTSTLFCCEDHFNLEQDMENYMRYRLTKGCIRLKSKSDTVPHIFESQPQITAPYETTTTRYIAICYNQNFLHNNQALVIPFTFNEALPESAESACVKEEPVDVVTTIKQEIEGVQIADSMFADELSNLAEGPEEHHGAVNFKHEMEDAEIGNFEFAEVLTNEEAATGDVPTSEHHGDNVDYERDPFEAKTESWWNDPSKVRSDGEGVKAQTSEIVFEFASLCEQQQVKAEPCLEEVSSEEDPLSLVSARHGPTPWPEEAGDPLEMPSRMYVPLWKCLVCEQSVVSRQALRTHMATHSGQPFFSCQECKMIFKSNNYLSRHKARHKGWHEAAARERQAAKQAAIDGVFTCDRCQKTFESRKTLASHRATYHSSPKRSECPHCGTSFSSPRTCQSHVNSLFCQSASIAVCRQKQFNRQQKKEARKKILKKVKKKMTID